MSIHKELSYDQKIERIKGIQFSVLSPDEITKSSVVEVTKTDTYTGNEPVPGGLFDPRMGVLEHNSFCRTCEQKKVFCPGHFGHIKLARPVFHPMFYETTRKLLKCICYRCSRMLISPTQSSDDLKEVMRKIMLIKNHQKRWEQLFKFFNNNSKIKSCGDDGAPGCGAKQPSRYTKEGTLKIMAEWKEPNVETVKKEFTAEDVLTILQRVTEEDMEVLGFNPKFNRPEWMVCTVLPVPPPPVRPSIIEENGQRREDDLTHKLCDIIKTNNQLKTRLEKPNANEEHLAVITGALQYHIATLIDNQMPGIPPAQQRNGRKLKSVSDRLKKKEGRIRGNLNGKRVDQSARSVITPDPYISLDQLGVPMKIAMNLTFRETVNKYNMEEMQRLVKNGPDVWPGAKEICKREDGKTYTLKYGNREKLAEELVEGDIVNRHLRDDDYVLFNRQPSLHKMSMMCHRVKVMPYQTFRLNVLVTSPYNADFDGDEMNLHVPQSIQTMSELKDFASVPYHIIGPKDGKPIIEVVQDTMLGSFRLTKDHVRISDKTFANLQMVNSYFDGILPEPVDKELRQYTGLQASSQILPPGFHLELKNKLKEKVKIVNGMHQSGILDKSIFHGMSTGVLPVIYHDYSPFEVRRYLDNLQRLICRWLLTSGFSVGISDLVVDNSIKDKIKTIISSMKTKAYEELEKVRLGQMENNSIMNNQDYFEQQLIGILNGATSDIEKNGLESINHMMNRMINMVQSGSKGKPTNVAQMIACVGQQNVDGKRVAYGFTDRTLPHYCKYDDGPEARGFVGNSFISGLTPQEMFFHAMGGREGLIDTAVKTSETGYIQRRLVKAMEDSKVNYDQTVRNANDGIVQFLYGEDGMEGTKIEAQNIRYIEMDIMDIEKEHRMYVGEDLKLYLTDKVFKDTMKDKKLSERCENHFQAILEDRLFLIEKVFKNQKMDRITYPIPFERIIKNAVYRMKDMGMDTLPSNLHPGYVLDRIEELISSKEALYIVNQNQGMRFLHILLRMHLSPKPMIYKYHMQKEVFDWIISEIHRYFKEAVVPAGEMVGIIAAQSLGEPATQLSTSFDTNIRVLSSNKNYTGHIGSFIDKLMDENPQDVIHLGNDSTALYLKEDYYIVGVSDNEKTAWRRILEVSRHPANGGMVTVKTRSGRKTTATLSHSFLKRTKEGTIVPIEGAKLQLGDRIPVARYIPTIENPISSMWIHDHSYVLDKEFGWVIGAYLADGCAHSNLTISKVEPMFEELLRKFAVKHGFTLKVREVEKLFTHDPKYSHRVYKSKDMTIGGIGSYVLAQWFVNNFQTGSYNKRIPAWVYASNKEFIAGILAGYFDGDGNVNVEKQMIRCHSVNEGLIEDMSLLLNYHGIFATKLVETRNREKANKMFVLSISKKYADTYKQCIGFQVAHKAMNLDDIIQYNERDDIHSVQDMVDQIPECGEAIAYIGERLKLHGQSRLYKRWLNKKAIGRRTLEKYIALFKAANDLVGNLKDVADKIVLLEQAVKSDIVWDEIVELEYLPDPEEYVYDFTVPGNDSFMVDAGILVHNTLDSFHVSGTAAAVKATSGVPRLKELLSVSRNIKTPTLQIYLKPEISQTIDPTEDAEGKVNDPRVYEAKERTLKVLKELEITKLGDLLSSTEIFWDPPGQKGMQTNIENDDKYLAIYREFGKLDAGRCRSSSPWVLRMVIDKVKLYRANLSMLDVYMKIYQSYGNTLECLFSDDNDDELIFHMRIHENALKDIESEDMVAALKAIEYNIVNTILLKGITKINKVSMRPYNHVDYNRNKEAFEKINEWILDTDGSNLIEMMAHPAVDPYRTFTNDIYEIYNVLGIEAARNALCNEIMEVIKESSVNFRHLSILIDTMTCKGALMSIDRHGINRGDVGPLAKSSFEETTDMLIKASIFSEYDRINGVSANIMLGQLPPCGTGDSEILLDEQEYISLVKDRINYVPESKESMVDSCHVDALKFTLPTMEKKGKKMMSELPKVTFV